MLKKILAAPMEDATPFSSFERFIFGNRTMSRCSICGKIYWGMFCPDCGKLSDPIFGVQSIGPEFLRGSVVTSDSVVKVRDAQNGDPEWFDMQSDRERCGSLLNHKVGDIVRVLGSDGEPHMVKIVLIDPHEDVPSEPYIPPEPKSKLIYELEDGGYVVVGAEFCRDSIINVPSEYDGRRVTSVGKRAFYDYKNVEKVIIEEGVSEIRASAFENCSSLVSIGLPRSLKKIDKYAFDGCLQLRNLKYYGTQWDWNAISINPLGNSYLTRLR